MCGKKKRILDVIHPARKCARSLKAQILLHRASAYKMRLRLECMKSIQGGAPQLNWFIIPIHYRYITCKP